MDTAINDKIREFVRFIRQTAPQNAVAFRLFANHQEHNIEFEVWDGAPSQNSYSMRDLRGEWIKNMP